jgi:hypothetical protein
MQSEYYQRRKEYPPTKTLAGCPKAISEPEEDQDNRNHGVFQHLY